MRQSAADRPATTALRHVQSQILAALRDPDDAIERLDAGLFLEPPRGTVAGRWAIYRSAYVVRLAEAIENDFPAVARITGATAFHGLCRRYLAAFPPSAHDIGRAGENLPGYLPADPVTTALPFLPDLARLEWALAEAVGAADAPALEWRDVASATVELLADTPLRLMPSAALIDSRWPLPSLWLAKDLAPEAVDIPVEGRPSTVLVSRRGLEPRWRSIEPDDRAVVEGASRGATPARILGSGAFGEGADAPLRFAQAFRRVVSDGALRPLPFPVSGAAERAPLSKENL